VKVEKEEASTWMRPRATLDQLFEILEQQILSKDDKNVIQIAEKLISDAEESLQMIEDNLEEAMFFKFIDKNQSLENPSNENDLDLDYEKFNIKFT